MSSVLLSVMMLGVFALVAGAFWLLGKGRQQGKAMLMIVAAAVLLGNVLLLAL